MSKETKPSGKKVRRQFSDEFKRDAVNLVVIEGYSFKRAAGAVGVSPNSLRGWYAKLAPDADAGARVWFERGRSAGPNREVFDSGQIRDKWGH